MEDISIDKIDAARMKHSDLLSMSQEHADFREDSDREDHHPGGWLRSKYLAIYIELGLTWFVPGRIL
jgi:hypothetical protein